MNIIFTDKTVPYAIFVQDVANAVARVLDRQRNDPEVISQRKAYAIFGRGNVDRWRRQGMIIPYKRPGKVEYRMADLRALQNNRQDNFKI